MVSQGSSIGGRIRAGATRRDGGRNHPADRPSSSSRRELHLLAPEGPTGGSLPAVPALPCDTRTRKRRSQCSGASARSPQSRPGSQPRLVRPASLEPVVETSVRAMGSWSVPYRIGAFQAISHPTQHRAFSVLAGGHAVFRLPSARTFPYRLPYLTNRSASRHRTSSAFTTRPCFRPRWVCVGMVRLPSICLSDVRRSQHGRSSLWPGLDVAGPSRVTRRICGRAHGCSPPAPCRRLIWAWAGPTCTLQLAHLGADVIKVESATRLDTARGLPPFWQHQHGANRSGYFNQYSTGKRSITLNLKSPEAVQIAYELIANADVVVDNFSAGTMERMGFGYERLRALNPGVIQISMAAHGRTGPTSQYIAYGPTQAPMIGLMSVTGYPGGGPREVGFSYGDPNGGINAALAVLAALYHRRRTGEGQYIDMSQWEAAIPLVTEALLAYQMNRAQPQRLGNRDEFEAPQ
ncbi:MAG: CaiB/BaiF CoA transferase family protein, partial [Dehalococcoidia bacterium]